MYEEAPSLWTFFFIALAAIAIQCLILYFVIYYAVSSALKETNESNKYLRLLTAFKIEQLTKEQLTEALARIEESNRIDKYSQYSYNERDEKKKEIIV